ncbi:MAG: gliding motility-associated C-terminal domain-containing protein, partial [Flavobacteriales bacterium]|nr:gliding motility-associated C-terminal domain-containing protein [Flavobacteriales bacterium]
TLDAGNAGATYMWGDNSTDQTYEVFMPGLYTVNVTTPFGCSDLFSMLVVEECEGVIYVPNAFTPDGDGINDVFMALGENIESFKMQIWNRWGELLFESNDMGTPWLGQRRDGEYFVPNGVYLYRITYRTTQGVGVTAEEDIELMGHISLVR